MKRVTGVGGIFFKSEDPDGMKAWYQRHLGINPDADGYVSFRWRDAAEPERLGRTVWNPFSAETKYFEPSGERFMVNYRVDDLDAVLAALREEGVTVDDKVERSEFGNFGWAMDPEGRRIELWEPPTSELGEAFDAASNDNGLASLPEA